MQVYFLSVLRGRIGGRERRDPKGWNSQHSLKNRNVHMDLKRLATVVCPDGVESKVPNIHNLFLQNNGTGIFQASFVCSSMFFYEIEVELPWELVHICVYI